MKLQQHLPSSLSYRASGYTCKQCQSTEISHLGYVSYHFSDFVAISSQVFALVNVLYHFRFCASKPGSSSRMGILVSVPLIDLFVSLDHFSNDIDLLIEQLHQHM
jgi:hypothetical protein